MSCPDDRIDAPAAEILRNAFMTTGGYVRVLQQLLAMHGASIEVDGSYGPLTAAAVRDLGREKADAKVWETLMKKR